MLRSLASVLVAIVVCGACSSEPDISTAGRPATDPADAPAVAEPLPTTAPLDVPDDGIAVDPPGDATSPDLPPEPSRDGAAAPLAAVQLVPAAADLPEMTNLTTAGDERLFITLQSGRIMIFAGSEVSDRPFLDIGDRTDRSASERGLLDVAFHPRYPRNGRLFVNYTDRNGDSVISEFRVDPDDPDRADPGSESIVLQLSQPFRNHNGGQIEFGPDGFLYIAMGDGGSSGDPRGNGQDPGTLLGAILRIDVDGDGPYSIPVDNPFVGDDAVRDEIWALGVRNPWGFSFDSATGDLWFGDVGQDEFEEINRQPAGQGGQNYGWNTLEAFDCFEATDCDRSGLTQPLYAYSHDGGFCSVTGGVVYRGQRHPAMQGLYFFGDLCVGTVGALDGAPDGDDSFFALNLGTFDLSSVAFAEDAAGHLYVADRLDDTLYRIEPAP